MGTPSPKETERNEALYNDWKIGLRGQKLADKYNISRQRALLIATKLDGFYNAAPSLEFNEE